MPTLDTYTTKQLNRLTVAQIAASLTNEQFETLADIDDDLVHSIRSSRHATVQREVGGFFTDVTDTVRALEVADLAQRVKTGWYLTPAGTLILKRHAGGAL